MQRLITVLFLALLVGCYTAPKEGLDLINDSISATRGHAKDAHGEFSPLARTAFETDADAWEKARKLIYGVAVSPETQARTDARKPSSGDTPETPVRPQ